MAPMDLSQLSSNWKKLQAILPSKKPDTEEASKRKRPQERPMESRKRHRGSSGTGNMIMAAVDTKNPRRPKNSKSMVALQPKDRGVAETGKDERPSSAQAVRVEAPNQGIENEGVSQTAIAGKYIALDCEMVGYGPNPKDDSQLARVSIVNFHGDQIYDSYVLPQVPVTDYRTSITGITAATLKTGRPFKEVQKDVSAFLSGRILIGHALKNDLDVLMLSHPRKDMRDTSRHAAYRALSAGKTPSLRKLCQEVLGLEIQTGVHSSVEDARAAMLLYKREKDAFEAEFKGKFGRRQVLDAAEAMAGTTKKKKKKKGKK